MEEEKLNYEDKIYDFRLQLEEERKKTENLQKQLQQANETKQTSEESNADWLKKEKEMEYQLFDFELQLEEERKKTQELQKQLEQKEILEEKKREFSDLQQQLEKQREISELQQKLEAERNLTEELKQQLQIAEGRRIAAENKNKNNDSYGRNYNRIKSHRK